LNAHEMALGALLHDVGKFLQRACPPGEGLSEQSRRLRETICPACEGRSSHLHVLYTNEFVANLPFWPEGVDAASVANLAAFHHRPDTPEQALVAEADRLSSAMEREPEDEGTVAGLGRYRRVRLQSVASTVQWAPGAPVAPAELDLAPLSARSGFPVARRADPREVAEDQTAAYQSLWQGFEAEWAHNRCSDPVGFINRACSVLERFAWCIPSATNVVPDISLYDHVKVTSAIAVCLWQAKEGAKQPFLLVSGDISGIQRYIFRIKAGTGGLARRLRARSFDVSVFAEAASLGMLRALGLPLSHRILFAGGKFHLLLPNTDEALRAIESARRNATEWLFDRSSGELSLSLASVQMSRQDVQVFSESVDRLQASLRDEKDRAALPLLAPQGQWDEGSFLLPFAVGPEESLCECCRQRGGPTREVRGREVPVCDVCHADAQRGRRLPGSRFLVFFESDAGDHATPIGSYSLADAEDTLPTDSVLVVDMDGTGRAGEGLPLIGSLRARHIPRHANGDAVTFDELSRRSLGRPALGFLKMDVDNLGFIFSQGLKGETADRTSISRVATLSRTLELFFAGFLNELLETDFPDVYLVYAGGDDLVAVGPWNIMFDLSARIRQDFRRFTGENPAWTLSAGLAVVGHHTPVLSAVEAADRHLEASKTVPGEDIVPWPLVGQAAGKPHKDRITAFGTSIPWDEFPAVMQRAKELLGWLQQDVLNTSKVRRLLIYSDMHHKFQQTGDTRYFQYVPMLVYDLRRNWGEKTEQEKRAKVWANSLATPESKEMRTVRFACEYALNGARPSGKGE